jgi:hypothetical protein
VVYSNSRLVAFLNGELLGQVDGVSKSADSIWIVATTINGQAKVWLDNVKFWKLDDVQIGPISTPIPTAGVPAFYEPIQSYLASANPTFEDDFSVQNAAWGGTSEGQAIYALVNGGVLTLQIMQQGEELWMIKCVASLFQPMGCSMPGILLSNMILFIPEE